MYRYIVSCDVVIACNLLKRRSACTCWKQKTTRDYKQSLYQKQYLNSLSPSVGSNVKNHANAPYISPSWVSYGVRNHPQPWVAVILLPGFVKINKSKNFIDTSTFLKASVWSGD